MGEYNMSKIITSKINCDITGKEETYEKTIIETKEGGRVGKTVSFPQPASCRNTECLHRDKSDCPVKKLNK
jgi:hypothetical protein